MSASAPMVGVEASIGRTEEMAPMGSLTAHSTYMLDDRDLRSRRRCGRDVARSPLLGQTIRRLETPALNVAPKGATTCMMTVEEADNTLGGRPLAPANAADSVCAEDLDMATRTQFDNELDTRRRRAAGRFVRAHSRRAHFMLPACNNNYRTTLQAAPRMNDPPK